MSKKSVPLYFIHSVILLLVLAFETITGAGAHAQVRSGGSQGVAKLEAEQQRHEGNLSIADGNVDILYQNMRLHADHVQYDTVSQEVAARGNVQFDYDNQHLEASEGKYNLQSGRGAYSHVKGTIQLARRPNASILLSPNPLYFEAEEVERLDERTYKFRSVWLTICEPEKPSWKFYAPSATLRLDRTVALVNANFRLYHVPLFYLPYASVPAGRKVRQSGFLVPEIATTSKKGFVVGDSFYWAPKEWIDLELGAQLLSKRGWSHNVDFRARPSRNTSINYQYFGVVDRGLKGPNGIRVPQGGHRSRLQLESRLAGGWRAVAHLDQLSSLIFRLAFATTFTEATISELQSAAFLTNNFRGFSLNFSALSYKEFLSAQPETSVELRSAPEARFSSVEQRPWKRWPIYFGFDSFAGALHRSDPNLETASAVQRSEFAPRIAVPLRWGPWLGVTTTAAFRTTSYGSQLAKNTLVGESARRNTGEFTIDLRPASLERTWANTNSSAAWKHTVEPAIAFHYVTGVHDFSRFIRFDEDETLTNTKEVEYSINQRLFRKPVGAQAEEFVSWRIAQKHYFDPTFGGAIVPGQRNVVAALDSITPFAFADMPRFWSPIISGLKITPGGRYELEFRTDYDSTLGKITALGTLLNLRPYRESFVNLSHFKLHSNPILQPSENQARAIVGWGQMNRRGWNSAFAISYDTNQNFLQYQVVQASYNGSCCGISFEFRRLALGAVRSENQFRVALLIANLGTFGTLRRQERLF